MGRWNAATEEYDYINWENIQWAIDNVGGLMRRWGHHPALYALEPVNEPWWNSDLEVLKGFYRAAREEVRMINKDVLFVFHESFQPDATVFNDLFHDDDMENVIYDTHRYMAWNKRTDNI